MNARDAIKFTKSKTGQVIVFGILFFIGASLLTGVLYFRHSAIKKGLVDAPNLDNNQAQKPSRLVFAPARGGLRQ